MTTSTPSKKHASGVAHVQTTLNNTIITVTDNLGNTQFSCSPTLLGFPRSRRSTTYAAQATAENIAQKCIQQGILEIEVRMKGNGYARESCLRGLQLGGLNVTHICDVTSMPHNGCRPPSKRRV